ncbi:MAG: molybdopterin molybdotransferase MoeA [Betaproteobacteria bacterium]|nr:molybdopterin molybdotransferase MoeA [Betaproteobacteria bacterium]
MNYFSLSAAQQIILQSTARLGMETIPLARSLNRVLAKDILSNRDHPPYAVSAMDGYAVRVNNLSTLPAILTVIEDIKAGTLPIKAVLDGQCARIMTGAAIPQGADTVIRVEDTETILSDAVQINTGAALGTNIRRQGENLRTGATVLKAGTMITPGVLGILAMVKCAQVPVYQQPRVAILSTGDELEGLDDPFDSNKIPDANSHTLFAQVLALGITPTLLGITQDDPLELAQAIRRGLDYDVLLISGGTSVGVHDYVRPTLAELNVHMHFWRVAIRPGHPFAFGTTAKNQVFCLPGNPVSSMVCFEQFVAPALRQATGHHRLYRRTLTARLSHTLAHRHQNMEFVRVRLAQDQQGYVATATDSQSSGVLLSMAHADGLLIVPADSNGLVAGEAVTVQCLDGMCYQNTPFGAPV